MKFFWLILGPVTCVLGLAAALGETTAHAQSTGPLLEFCGKSIQLQSWKGDFLHRPDSPQGVSTWNTGVGNEWTVVCSADKVQLQSWKGDFLHRPDSPQGVTTWNTGAGNEWTVEAAGTKIKLKSWKGDYLHRPDSPQGVSTWNTGAGNEWTVVPVRPVLLTQCGKTVQLQSWKGDFLHRPDSPQGVTTSNTGIGNLWKVICVGDKVQLQSWKGDSLHRPDSPQGVTTWNTGAGNEWTVEAAGGKVRLKSWKGDYLHRPDSPQGVTTWNTGGNEWTVFPVPEQSVIEYLFPKSIRFAAGENCQEPAQKDGNTGVALYSVTSHPRNPQRIIASFALAFRQDCGHAGHAGAHGAESHPGDMEYFYYTLKQDASCSRGWRIHALKTVAHSADYKRREINERILDSCEPPEQLVSSLGKHALYTSWLDCTKRTPAEVCLDGFGASFKLYDVGTPGVALPDLSSLMGGPALGPDKIFKSQGDGRFCGGQNIGNRADCVGAPGDKLSMPGGGDEWEIPCPDAGQSHSCPYGLDESAGLCYQPCREGYSGHVTMCIPGCPSAFRDDGLYCFKPESYGRGAGYPWKFGDGFNDSGMFRRCEEDHGAGNCEKNGLIVYPKCKPGFHSVGCCVCSPDCPPDTTDIGVSCQKHTYDRGVGCLP